MDTTFLDFSTVPTLERTYFRIGSCGTRLPSVQYVKNILNQKSQNVSDQLIKELKTKLEYLPLHLSLAAFFSEKAVITSWAKNGAYEINL